MLLNVVDEVAAPGMAPDVLELDVRVQPQARADAARELAKSVILAPPHAINPLAGEEVVRNLAAHRISAPALRHSLDHALQKTAANAHEPCRHSLALNEAGFLILLPTRKQAHRKANALTLLRVDAGHHVEIMLKKPPNCVSRKTHVIIQEHEVGAFALKEIRDQLIAGERNVAVARQELDVRHDAAPG